MSTQEIPLCSSILFRMENSRIDLEINFVFQFLCKRKDNFLFTFIYDVQQCKSSQIIHTRSLSFIIPNNNGFKHSKVFITFMDKKKFSWFRYEALDHPLKNLAIFNPLMISPSKPSPFLALMMATSSLFLASISKICLISAVSVSVRSDLNEGSSITRAPMREKELLLIEVFIW